MTVDILRADALPDDWCYSCWRSEPWRKGAYISCYECGHVYYTPRELRKAYRRQLAATTFPKGYRRKLFGHDPFNLTWFELVWRRVFVRASRVYFCQECAHDF